MTNKEILEKYYHFLNTDFNFNIEIIENSSFMLHANFLSDSVGLIFIYEFRELSPWIQISKLDGNKLEIRPGWYKIKELYKNADFILHSFSLQDILSYKRMDNYNSYFHCANTIEDIIIISSELLKKYAIEFIQGDEESYFNINKWLKKQAIESH